MKTGWLPTRDEVKTMIAITAAVLMCELWYHLDPPSDGEPIPVSFQSVLIPALVFLIGGRLRAWREKAQK